MVNVDYAREFFDEVMQPLIKLGLYETYEFRYKKSIQDAVRHDLNMRSHDLTHD